MIIPTEINNTNEYTKYVTSRVLHLPKGKVEKYISKISEYINNVIGNCYVRIGRIKGLEDRSILVGEKDKLVPIYRNGNDEVSISIEYIMEPSNPPSNFEIIKYSIACKYNIPSKNLKGYFRYDKNDEIHENPKREPICHLQMYGNDNDYVFRFPTHSVDVFEVLYFIEEYLIPKEQKKS